MENIDFADAQEELDLEVDTTLQEEIIAEEDYGYIKMDFSLETPEERNE